MLRPASLRACVFDAYGTLFDTSSAVARCAAVPPDKRAPLSALWRDKQLQYTWLRSLQARYADFEQVTSAALDYALEHLGLPDTLKPPLMTLYRKLDPYPEVADVLRQLRQRGLSLAILSNGTPAMLQDTVTHAGLDQAFDAILSADAVSTYKPAPEVYRYGLNQLGLRAEEVVFLSSNGWDAYGASAFGMQVLWCNRAGATRERLPGEPDGEIGSLADLPPLIGA